VNAVPSTDRTLVGHKRVLRFERGEKGARDGKEVSVQLSTKESLLDTKEEKDGLIPEEET